MIFPRNGVEFMTFDSIDNRIHSPKELRIIGGKGKCKIFEADETTKNALRIMNTEYTLHAFVSFGVNANNHVLVVRDTSVDYSAPIKCSELNSHGNFDVVSKRNSVEFMTVDGTNDVIECSKGSTVNRLSTIKNNPQILKIEDSSNQRYIRSTPGRHIYSFDGGDADAGDTLYLNYYSENTVIIGSSVIPVGASDVIFNRPLKCDAFSSHGNNDIVFQRNRVDYMKFSDNVVNFDGSIGIYSNHVRCMRFFFFTMGQISLIRFGRVLQFQVLLG